jgi:hypothetical protein
MEDAGEFMKETAQLKKVGVKALDLDWIFVGDNAKNLLSLLASDADPAILSKKSMRIFIEVMWEYYQKAIIIYIFLPYILYLSLLSYLGGNLVGPFINSFYDDLTDEDNYRNHVYYKI